MNTAFSETYILASTRFKKEYLVLDRSGWFFSGQKGIQSEFLMMISVGTYPMWLTWQGVVLPFGHWSNPGFAL